jgi:cytochrome bd-type quinol oxidase subunit 2
VGCVASIGKGVVCSFCVGNLNRKTQFERSRHRRMDNIKTDLLILSVCVVFSCLCDVLNVLMFAQLLGGWLAVSTRKVLRPATSAQVLLLGFPVSKSKC